MSSSHFPCHRRPCRSSQGHSTARPSIAALWATCWRSASPGYHAEFHEIVTRRIPISDAGGQCETKHRLSWTRKRVVAAHYKKDDLLQCWTSSSDISGYHADIHEGHGTVGRAGARHAMCESALSLLFLVTLQSAGRRQRSNFVTVHPLQHVVLTSSSSS